MPVIAFKSSQVAEVIRSIGSPAHPKPLRRSFERSSFAGTTTKATSAPSVQRSQSDR
jgi:hypothetical protein